MNLAGEGITTILNTTQYLNISGIRAKRRSSSDRINQSIKPYRFPDKMKESFINQVILIMKHFNVNNVDYHSGTANSTLTGNTGRLRSSPFLGVHSPSTYKCKI